VVKIKAALLYQVHETTVITATAAKPRPVLGSAGRVEAKRLVTKAAVFGLERLVSRPGRQAVHPPGRPGIRRFSEVHGGQA
jgi:hypothetical protein